MRGSGEAFGFELRGVEGSFASGNFAIAEGCCCVFSFRLPSAQGFETFFQILPPAVAHFLLPLCSASSGMRDSFLRGWSCFGDLFIGCSVLLSRSCEDVARDWEATFGEGLVGCFLLRCFGDFDVAWVFGA